jgi:hypothetical protein
MSETKGTRVDMAPLTSIILQRSPTWATEIRLAATENWSSDFSVSSSCWIIYSALKENSHMPNRSDCLIGNRELSS